MATAVMVAGSDGAKWFSQEELSGYALWAITATKLHRGVYKHAGI